MPLAERLQELRPKPAPQEGRSGMLPSRSTFRNAGRWPLAARSSWAQGFTSGRGGLSALRIRSSRFRAQALVTGTRERR